MTELDYSDTIVPDPAVVMEGATEPEPSAFGEAQPEAAPPKPYVPESAMAVFAHPDDVEFSCSGTLARWARQGARVSIILCTSGDVGIAREGITRQEAAAVREAEAQDAAHIIGAAEIIFLREPDGLLQATLDLRRRLVREIRRFRPEVLVTGDPTVVWAGDNYINHPDHRAAALAAVEAVFPAAGQPHVFEELAADGLTAHKVRKVYVSNWREGTTWEAIDGRHHRCQGGRSPGPQEPDGRMGRGQEHPRVGRRPRQRPRHAVCRDFPRRDARKRRGLGEVQGPRRRPPQVGAGSTRDPPGTRY
jgi:LmbE family N-acetylglucosaminyl deacetylase